MFWINSRVFQSSKTSNSKLFLSIFIEKSKEYLIYAVSQNCRRQKNQINVILLKIFKIKFKVLSNVGLVARSSRVRMNKQRQIRALASLPLVTFNELMVVLLCLALLKLAVTKILARTFDLIALKPDIEANQLQYSPFYHLAIVVLVLPEVNWNMFDLAIWMLIYTGIGIIRRGILAIRNQREVLLNGYSFDLKTLRVLQSSKSLGALLLGAGITLLIGIEVLFEGSNVKLMNLLIFPVLMLIVDTAFLFLCSAASQKDILCYYNQNINEIQPTYKLQLAEKIVGSSVKIWHFYNLIRLFIRGLLDKMGILDYMWIFSLLNACFVAIKSLLSSISKYRSYNRLMKKFDRLFRRSTSAPDQICTICLSELLNCRQLAACGHFFHYRCLFQWMQTKMECPICRAPIQLS